MTPRTRAATLTLLSLAALVRYTFVARNKGQTTHALEITGPGLKNATTATINPGQSATLTVTFKKGTYDVFCPLPGHKALGMNVNLVVRVRARAPQPLMGATTTAVPGG